MKYDIVVVGGVAAGTSAGATAKRQDPSLEVLLIQREKYISYGGCGLPYYVEGIMKTIDEIIEFTPQALREKKGVEVMTLHEVEEVDFGSKTLKVRNLETGDSFKVEYGKLVISTGGRAMLPAFARVDDERIFTIRAPDDAIRLRRCLEEDSPREAVIIGGGYIGVEMSEAISAHGVRVTLIEALDRLLINAEPEINEVLVNALEKNGVNVVLSDPVERIEPGERLKVVTKSAEFDADLVLVAVGVVPNTGIFHDLQKGVKGAIKVDSLLRTSVDDVFAAGDCATARHIVTGKDVYMPLGTTANKQGRVAGRIAASGRDRFEGIVGSSITKIFDVEFARTGLTEAEAIMEGFEATSVYIKGKSEAGYWPSNAPVHIKLVFDKKTGRILGTQMAGRHVHRRIDVIATAIYGNLSVIDLKYLDLAYAPPFSPVWDPVLIAANVARREL